METGPAVDSVLREGSVPVTGSAPTNVSDSYKKMACYNLATNQLVGYVGAGGSLNASVSIVANKADGANVKWAPAGSDMYLEKDTDPNDRYLGVGTSSAACWGLWTPTGWINPIVYNPDRTISLKEDPRRKLYGPYRLLGSDWAYWSEPGDNNQNILRFEMVE